MENASKALLIAGAVLIVILLIGIGMLIYSRSTGVVDIAANSMNAQQIQAFNSQFTPYEGVREGVSVRTLINAIIANNASNSNKVYVKLDRLAAMDDNESLSSLSDTVESNEQYKISFLYVDKSGNDSKGLISGIKIEEI